MGRSKGESPVIVQGTAVVQGTPVARPAPRNNGDVPYGGATQVSQNNSNDQQEGSKTGCKDPFFAILFYVNIIGVFATVFALSGSSGDGVIAAADYGGYVLRTRLYINFVCVGFLQRKKKRCACVSFSLTRTDAFRSHSLFALQIRVGGVCFRIDGFSLFRCRTLHAADLSGVYDQIGSDFFSRHAGDLDVCFFRCHEFSLGSHGYRLYPLDALLHPRCLAAHSVRCHQHGDGRNRHQIKPRCHDFRGILHLATTGMVYAVDDCLL